MPKSKRKSGALFSAFALFALLAMLTAACVPITDTRVPASSPQAGATLAPAAESEDATAETATAETATAEVAASGEETVVAEAAAPVITHNIKRRADCLECHEVESGRDPAPADHAAMTEAVCLYCHLSEDNEVAPPPLPEEADAAFCLGCHGPFEDLAARTEAAFVVKGVEANPHMNVPHDGTKPFKCTNCHEVHELPVPPAMEFPEVGIDYCYQSCHHEEDFTPCTSCHEGDDEE